MKLANRFEILETLEQGAYGITYRARDHQSSQPECVVKELTCTSPHMLKLFRQEVNTLKKIGQHPQIPELLAYFDHGNRFYLAQAFITGHALTQEIKAGKRLDEGYVTKLLRDILSVLAVVHQHRIIHRDIQPANLMRQASNGDIVLVDFGAIKELSHSYLDPNGRVITPTKVGVVGYIAPEQGRGEPCYASDLYSVGMVAIAALADISPRQLAIHPLTHQVQWSDGSISPALEVFIKRLIHPNPKKRYPTATEALQALERTMTGIRVGKDSRLPTHVVAKDKLTADSVSVTKTVDLIPPGLILKVMGTITAALVILGFGVKGYQWTARALSTRWDAVKAATKTTKRYDEAKPDELVALLDDGSIQTRPEVVDAFWAMVAAAKNEGVELLPLAGYISLSEQRKTLQNKADVDVGQWLQQSDYHSGYAVAIGDKNADESTDWDSSFEQTDGYRWLRRYAKNYGFEMSYPQGNPRGEKEPWHWRYVAN